MKKAILAVCILSMLAATSLFSIPVPSGDQEIHVKQGTRDIGIGDVIGLGPDPVDVPRLMQFTIFNQGTTDNLLISGFTLTGADVDNDQFRIFKAPDSPVAPGGSSTFIIIFRGTSSGFKFATVTILSNDADENPYTFTLRYLAVNTPPDIHNTQAGQTVNDNATIHPFSNVVIADLQNLTASVTIDNINKGSFTPSSLSGFAYAGGGKYTISDVRLLKLTQALRSLCFDPVDTWPPPPGGTETVRFTIEVSDVEYTTTDNITTVIITYISDLHLGDIANQTIPENGETDHIPLNITNDSNSPFQIIGWADNKTLVPDGNIHFRGSGYNRDVRIVAAHGQSGETRITIKVWDGYSEDRQSFTLTVTSENNPPRIDPPIPPVVFDEDQSSDIALDDYVSDPDHPDDQIVWSAEVLGNSSPSLKTKRIISSYEGVLVDIDNNTRIATVSATQNWFGSDVEVIFIARDPDGQTDRDTTTVTVNPVNDKPEFTEELPGITMGQGDTSSKPLSEWWDKVYDPETPDSALIWDATGGSHVAHAFSGDTLVLTAPADWSGTDTLNVVISDGALTDTTELIVQVSGVSPKALAATGLEQSCAAETNGFALAQNYPNPFNPVTSISYQLPGETHVIITVYNMAGQIVAELANGTQSAGWHTVQWDASRVGTGVYFYKMQTDAFTRVRRAIIMK